MSATHIYRDFLGPVWVAMVEHGPQTSRVRDVTTGHVFDAPTSALTPL